MNIVEMKFTVNSKDRSQMLDITDQVQAAVEQSRITRGDVIIYCPHTTAAITINENADPAVQHDMILTLNEIFPSDRVGYRHIEGNSDAHAKSSVTGCSEQVLLKDGRLDLGRWQGIYFCEFDGPRNRNVILQIRGE